MKPMRLAKAVSLSSKLFRLTSGAEIRGTLMSVDLTETGVFVVIRGRRLGDSGRGGKDRDWKILAGRVAEIHSDEAVDDDFAVFQ